MLLSATAPRNQRQSGATEEQIRSMSVLGTPSPGRMQERNRRCKALDQKVLWDLNLTKLNLERITWNQVLSNDLELQEQQRILQSMTSCTRTRSSRCCGKTASLSWC